jgi:hypothetical protein
MRTASIQVTALDFSKLNPMTLAVGLNNGDINIYNVKREGDKFEVLSFVLYMFLFHIHLYDNMSVC